MKLVALKSLKMLQPSSRYGHANFVPWKMTLNWISVQLVGSGDIHMARLYPPVDPTLALESFMLKTEQILKKPLVSTS